MRPYLDVDGVLCDWTASVHRALGLPYDYNNWPYAKGPEGWHWHNEVGWTFDAVSTLCDFSFWENALWTHDGPAILSIVLDYFAKEDIILLTTPMPHVDSASGKIAWIRKNLPTFERQVLICPGHKAETGLPLVPDSILLDDGQCNVRDWNAAGGKAILVPRWWNDRWGNALNAPEFVRRQLEAMCE